MGKTWGASFVGGQACRWAPSRIGATVLYSLRKVSLIERRGTYFRENVSSVNMPDSALLLWSKSPEELASQLLHFVALES